MCGSTRMRSRPSGRRFQAVLARRGTTVTWMPKKLDSDVPILNTMAQKPAGCFRILSFHGTCGRRVGERRRRAHGALGELLVSPACSRLWMDVQTRPNMILIAADQPASGLGIGDQRFPHGAAWLRLEACDGGFFHLRHPKTGRYLCAHPPKQNMPDSGGNQSRGSPRMGNFPPGGDRTANRFSI